MLRREEEKAVVGLTPLLFPSVSHIPGTLTTLLYLRIAQMQDEGQEQNSGRTGSLLLMLFIFGPRTHAHTK